MNQPAQFDIILPAIRLGFARAASEAGLTPSEAEAKLAAMSKQAAGATSGLWDLLHSLVENSFVIPAAGAAIVGGLSGVARHDLERKLDNKDDPAIQADEEKAKQYEKMTEDLKRQQQAGSSMPEYNAPRVQEAMR